jgi:hypothetical protein
VKPPFREIGNNPLAGNNKLPFLAGFCYRFNLGKSTFFKVISQGFLDLVTLSLNDSGFDSGCNFGCWAVLSRDGLKINVTESDPTFH